MHLLSGLCGIKEPLEIERGQNVKLKDKGQSMCYNYVSVIL